MSSSAFPPVLDACCGSRMFWFHGVDVRALFVDKRRETCVADTREGRRAINVNPDLLADFKSLPFPDAMFALVIFDPPHTTAGPKSWTRKKYGTLTPDWRKEISAGFAECFRVLCPLGTLIFKWNEHRVPVSTVLSLTPEQPLFGQRCGTTARTHWIVFMKQSRPSDFAREASLPVGQQKPKGPALPRKPGEDLARDYFRNPMSERIGDTFVIAVEADGKCELCGKVAELRAYGPNGKSICFECGMKDENTTKRNFEQVIAGVRRVVDTREGGTNP